MKRRIIPAVLLAARFILGGVFIYASLDKLANPEQFAAIIYNYKILPPALINLAAITLPVVELGTGLMVLAGVLLFPAALILTGLLIVFSLAIGAGLARGLDFHCGCFTTNPNANAENILTLLRDLALLPAAGITLYASWLKDRARLKKRRG